MKIFYIFLICIFNGILFGQWTNDYNVNTKVADAKSSDIQSVGTNDGKTFVVFWDEDNGYDLRVQLLDKDGNQLFGPNGIQVNSVADNGTWTATRSNVVDEDGNLIVGFTATNDGNGYINKISPDGTQLFGDSGITIPDAWDLKLLALPGGNLLAGWMGGSTGMLMKYDTNGLPLWTSPLSIASPDSSQPYTNTGELAALSDGSFTVILHTKATGWMIDSILWAVNIDAEGNQNWAVQISNQTTASNRRYPLIQDGDVIYFGYYGSTGFRFDSFLQRINPDGTLPWGINGKDFSINDTLYEMTTSIAFDSNSDYIWSTANVCNDLQSEYGQFLQKFDKETGEQLLGNTAKEIFPVSAINWISVGDLQLVNNQPLFLFSNNISNGVNPIQLGVVFLDANGDFKWEEGYRMIATSPGNKFRYDFTKNVDNQSVAVWSEERNGANYGFAQNIIVQDESQSVNDIDSNKFFVYPNPTSGFIYIKTDQPVQKIEILDLNGRMVLQKMQSTQINLINLQNGVYVIKASLINGKTIQTKIIRK